MKILIVDDDPDYNNAVSAMLTRAFPEAELFVVRDGSKAVEDCFRLRPEIILLDMMLPGRSGFLVLEKIKMGGIPVDKPPIVIMVTGNPGARHKQWGIHLGTWKYIIKKSDVEDTMRAIERAVEDALALLKVKAPT